MLIVEARMEEATLADLKPDTNNARAHNPRNVGMIVDALQEVGAARSVVIDEHGRILAGNATVEAAATAGIERVRIIDADGEELIAVRRSGLTDAQKKRLAYFDNRTGELATWDAAQALADVTAGMDFEGIFSELELSEIAQMVPRIDFPEYDESVADEVEYITCPECGAKFPK